MKLCIECKHYTVHPHAPDRPDLGLCTALEAPKSPVDGSHENGIPQLFCKVARQSPCGRDARYYEAKGSAFPEMPKLPEVKYV